MKFKIGEWLIDGTSGDWTVCKEVLVKNDDTGEEKTAQRQQSYYGTLYQAMLCVFNRKLSEEDAKDTREIIDTVNKIGKEIKEAADEAQALLKEVIKQHE